MKQVLLHSTTETSIEELKMVLCKLYGQTEITINISVNDCNLFEITELFDVHVNPKPFFNFRLDIIEDRHECLEKCDELVLIVGAESNLEHLIKGCLNEGKLVHRFNVNNWNLETIKEL